MQAGRAVSSPLGSVDFLSNAHDVLLQKCRASTPKEFTDPATYIAAFDWLVTYQLAQGLCAWHGAQSRWEPAGLGVGLKGARCARVVCMHRRQAV